MHRDACNLDDVVRWLGLMMAGFAVPWGVAGGWAIDLFLGRVTRPHADVELAIFRQDQLLLQRHMAAWQFDKIVNRQRVAWGEGELLELPVHEIHGRSTANPGDASEILLNERDGGNWIFRRNASVTMPVDGAFMQSNCGLPILAPQIVLLYKSKSTREKDDADFLAVREALGPARREWLRAALRICNPSHRWLKSLDTVVVRAAVPDDAEPIARIHYRAVRVTAGAYYPEPVLHGWSPPPDAARTDRIRQKIAAGDELFLIAEFDGVACGFGSIVPGTEELRAVYVDPDFGRRGVGSAILQRLEQLARQRGVPRLSMDASLNAEAFYARHGYSTVGRGMHRLASGVEMQCVHMHKAIRRPL